MPISPPLVTRFFQLLTQRSITEAERLLEKIEEKVSKSDERAAGYVAALEGALIALKSNDDRYAFILKIEPEDKNINKFKNEFLKHSRSEVHSTYDRGFFSAWSEYMRVLSKAEKKQGKVVKEEKEEAPPEKVVTHEEDDTPKKETKIPPKETKPPEAEVKAEIETVKETTAVMMEKQVEAVREKVAEREMQQKEKIAREEYFPKGEMKQERKPLKGNVQTRLDNIFGSRED